MIDEKVDKRMVIGMTARAEWEKKINSFFRDISGRIGIVTSEEDRGFLAELSCKCSNLIYAGILSSVEFLFNEETVELGLVYYPGGDEEDDLDLSVLSVVDWEVDVLNIRLNVEDRDFAAVLVGKILKRVPGRFTVEILDHDDNNDKEEGKRRNAGSENTGGETEEDADERAGSDDDQDKMDDESLKKQKKSNKKKKKEGK